MGGEEPCRIVEPWAPSEVEVRTEGSKRKGWEKLVTEEHTLPHLPVTVPVTVPGAVHARLTYPSNPGRWTVVPFHR